MPLLEEGSSSRMQLIEVMDQGLHAMAQPLTVLRGALGALILRDAVGPEHSRYLDVSNAQVERLCALMSGLRNLLDVAQHQAVCEQMDLWELAAALLEEQKTVLEKSPARIAATKPDVPLLAIGDRNRTKQALLAVLNAAVALSSHHDVIQLRILPGDGLVDLRVENRNPHGKKLGSTERLHLALAEVNVHSQQGLYAYAEDPFCVSIKLPLQGENDRGRKAASCKLALQGTE